MLLSDYVIERKTKSMSALRQLAVFTGQTGSMANSAVKSYVHAQSKSSGHLFSERNACLRLKKGQKVSYAQILFKLGTLIQSEGAALCFPRELAHSFVIRLVKIQAQNVPRSFGRQISSFRLDKAFQNSGSRVGDHGSAHDDCERAILIGLYHGRLVPTTVPCTLPLRPYFPMLNL
jgi:hypothetical protein